MHILSNFFPQLRSIYLMSRLPWYIRISPFRYIDLTFKKSDLLKYFSISTIASEQLHFQSTDSFHFLITSSSRNSLID